VVGVGTILPPGAPAEYQDPKKLFNAIESYETSSNARTAKKIMVALPREFDLAQQKAVIEDYIRANITAQGYACTYAIHTDRERSNPHAHILIANRQITEQGEWEKVKTTSEFVRDKDGNKVPIIDEKTGEQKVDSRNRKKWKRQNVSANPLDKKETLESLREQWAAECNKHLAPEQQIDHRSYAAQGKEEEPTIHEGYVARKIERQGGVSDRCEQNRQISQRNSRLRQIQEKMEEIFKQITTIVIEKGASINDRLEKYLGRNEAAKSNGGIAEGERESSRTETESFIRETKAKIAYSRDARANRESKQERYGVTPQRGLLLGKRKDKGRGYDLDR
jgi:ElaB/YqjD/DUF883 family membrane-anchored ribosome-binding protein